jgi:transposase
LHRLFLQQVPGGAARKKSTAQYATLLAGVRPRDGEANPAADGRVEVADLRRLDAQLKDLTAELKAHVLDLGSHLMDIYGIGPAGAARILTDVGDVARFPDRSHFASWTGTAPIDAASGEHVRHRLSRGGNRRLNHVLYMAGIVQLRRRHRGPRLLPPQASAGQDVAGGDAVPAPAAFRRGLPPARRRRRGTCGHRRERGPCRALGGDCLIQRDRPDPGHRLFGPATARTCALDASSATTTGKTTGRGTADGRRRRAGGVNVQRPTERTTLTPTRVGAHSTSSPTPSP